MRHREGSLMRNRGVKTCFLESPRHFDLSTKAGPISHNDTTLDLRFSHCPMLLQHVIQTRLRTFYIRQVDRASMARDKQNTTETTTLRISYVGTRDSLSVCPVFGFTRWRGVVQLPCHIVASFLGVKEIVRENMISIGIPSILSTS